MIDDKQVLALIPARGGSKGLPRKNIIDLCGKPLIAWVIDTLKNSQHVDRLVVSTDDREIADTAAGYGAEVPFMRPPELATDSATSFAVIQHAFASLRQAGEDYDYLVFLEPTSPLTAAEDVDAALQTLHQRRGIADSIVGVSEVISTHPLFDVHIDGQGLLRPYVGEDFGAPVRRQELEKLYCFDGSLYISEMRHLLAVQSFYHDRTLAYVVPKWKSIEIDDMVDLVCAEAIMKNIHLFKGDKA